MKWPTYNIKALAVYFGHDMVACYKAFGKRKTLYGKATIIKSLGLANLTYLRSCLLDPDNFVKKMDTILYNFLWNRKPEKIK